MGFSRKPELDNGPSDLFFCGTAVAEKDSPKEVAAYPKATPNTWTVRVDGKEYPGVFKNWVGNGCMGFSRKPKGDDDYYFCGTVVAKLLPPPA
jgi:hypothetical protein